MFRGAVFLNFIQMISGLYLGMATVYAHAETPRILFLSNQSGVYSAAGHLAYFEDSGGEMTLEEILSKTIQSEFIDAGSSAPNFGVTSSSYWFRVILKNTENVPVIWWLELQDSLLDHIDIFRVYEDETFEHNLFGDHYPLGARTIRTRNPVLSLDFKANEEISVYIKIKTYGVMNAPVYIWKPSIYPGQAVDAHMEHGLYFGVIIALLFYNLMLFFSVRDPSYLYYCIFISAYAFCQFCYNGMAYQYLWPSRGYLNLFAVFIASDIYLVAMLQFTRYFMRIPKFFPRLNVFMLFMIGCVIVPLFLFFVVDKNIGIRANLIYQVFLILLVLSIGIFAYFKKIQEARYFLFAWLALLVGMFVFQLMMFGVLPANFFTVHGQQIGSAMEAILLSFALAHRMRLLTEENERMSEEIQKNLEKRVQGRTKELNEAMQQLLSANILLKESSLNDGLTGARNRLYFDEQYNKEWRFSRREKRPLALLMLDIDHFKAINDNYGHLCGDYALCFITETLKEVVNRPGDIVARYGGEEFAVLLPDTNIEGAYTLAERIRVELENRVFRFNDHSINLTVSIGCVADCPYNTNRNLSGLIEAADKAMYAAKRSGRNSVKTA